jgi:hypothetical protein
MGTRRSSFRQKYKKRCTNRSWANFEKIICLLARTAMANEASDFLGRIGAGRSASARQRGKMCLAPVAEAPLTVPTIFRPLSFSAGQQTALDLTSTHNYTSQPMRTFTKFTPCHRIARSVRGFLCGGLLPASKKNLL